MARLILGVIVGVAAWVGVGATGMWVLRHSWDAYALAEPHKAYSLSMLLARLTVGAACSLVAGWLSTVTTKGESRAAWCVGGIVLLESARVHFFVVWADYPAWYHFAYLLSLMPLTLLGNGIARRRPNS